MLTGMGYTIQQTNEPTGEDMKFSLIALLLIACNKVPSNPPPKIAEPQREALEKARGVEQTLQKASEAEQQNINEAAGK